MSVKRCSELWKYVPSPLNVPSDGRGRAETSAPCRKHARANRFGFWCILLILGFELTQVSVAYAAPPTKEECVESHSRGQDLRERNQLADASRLFLLCAQQSCPAIVQSDCARLAEELGRAVPSLSFSAHDASGADVPDTSVFVDGLLVASQLDDGKAYNLDPGRHLVRFSRGDKQVSISIVLALGERGRNVSVSFPSEMAMQANAAASARAPERVTSGKNAAPLVFSAIGAATLLTGGVVGLYGLSRIPEACTTSPRECRGAPGTAIFDEARSAVNLANLGLGIAAAGLVAGVVGLVWYWVSPAHEREGRAIGSSAGHNKPRDRSRATGRLGATSLFSF
jgi:hypothetical protein